MSEADWAESPALALRNIGLSSRDLMAAINRMGSGLGRMSLASDHSLFIPDQETSSNGFILDAFHPFGELPSELRLKIWSYVCSHPRNVDIFTEHLGRTRVGSDTYFNTYMYYSHFCPHPAILHVCREAREEGLRHYELEFGTWHHFPLITISTPPRIYVNFAHDRLCLLEPEYFGSEQDDRFRGFVQICRKYGARSLAINVGRDKHWPIVDVATSWNIEELVLFGSVDTFDLSSSAGVPIEFVKPYGAHLYDGDEYIEEAAVRQLEIARRDFLALFEMHNDGLQFDRSHESESRAKRTKEALSWKPPVVEICHLIFGGKQDKNDSA